VTLGELLDGFCGVRAVVVGDLMLDEYIFGKATRISPEAPVMVVRQQSTACMPGGAANVAKNLIALGAEATMIGVVGCDRSAELLRDALEEQGIDHGSLVHDATRPTTRKTRVLADHAHQVLRIDHEEEGEISHEAERQMMEAVQSALAKADVVVLSDYLKGALNATMIRFAIEMARAGGIPVVANPKPRSLRHYAGATLVSLNRLEAGEALDDWRGLTDANAVEAAGRLRDSIQADAVLVTLGESGMVAAGDRVIQVRAPRVEVYDTAGAGDTVVATVAAGMATAGFVPEVFELAAQTAATVVRKVGVATPTPEDLLAIRASS
jgi:rfaE bifunctional protein kinase chain/domain